MKSALIIIELEIEKSLNYLKKDDITVNECLQEIGSLKMLVQNLKKE